MSTTAALQFDVPAIKAAATDRWPEIFTSLAGIGSELLDGRHGPCPRCNGQDRFRFFNDGTGGAICNQCFSQKNSDGISVIMWLLDCNFPTALAKIAGYLNIGPAANGQASAIDIVELVARKKKMPVESFKAYGARAEMRGKMKVARVPIYNEKGEEFSYFDLNTKDGEDGKGLCKKGDGNAGLSFPHADGQVRLPKADETWLIVEGVKDASALHGLGFLACGLPTNNMAIKYARLFAGVNCIIVPDRDTAGEAGSQTTAARLRSVAATVKIATLPAEFKQKGGADVRDVLAKGGGEQLLRQAIADAKPWQPADAGDDLKDAVTPWTPEGRNDLANARRLVAIHGDSIRWCDPWGKWLVWDGKAARTEAERVAAKFEAELRTGRYQTPSKVTWADFRQRYETEVLPGLAQNTDKKVTGVFNSLEATLNPTRLRDVNERQLSRYQSELRKAGRSDDTIAGHLAHIGAALRWAERIGLLPKAPRVEKPKRAKGSKSMKGRPITLEELERMLAKTATVVGEAIAPSWHHYLWGMWWGGLRLTESLELYWDRDDRLCVDLMGKHPMLRIPAEFEKGHRDRMLPIAPEFAEFLLSTPEQYRTGPVFNPRPKRGQGLRLSSNRVSRVAALIGEAAGVKVNTDPRTGRIKYASVHDLRRSFGERWAARIMPPDLMILMRHENIQTTMRFYVGRNAQNTAKTLWEAHRRATAGQDTPAHAEWPACPPPCRG